MRFFVSEVKEGDRTKKIIQIQSQGYHGKEYLTILDVMLLIKLFLWVEWCNWKEEIVKRGKFGLFYFKAWLQSISTGLWSFSDLAEKTGLGRRDYEHPGLKLETAKQFDVEFEKITKVGTGEINTHSIKDDLKNKRRR